MFPTIWRRSGCRSRPIAHSRRSRASSRARRTCIITPPRGERSSTGPPGCGVATPDTTGRRSWPRSSARRRARFHAELPVCPSAGLPARLAPGRAARRATSIMCSSANSGSETVDTALKIALAYPTCAGKAQRQRLIGRERGYHGVGFGGISVGGIVNNRKLFGSLLAGVDHLPTTHDREHQAFTRGQPEWGAHLADELENLVALHDARPSRRDGGADGGLDRRAAPRPGYLQRLRAISTATASCSFSTRSSPASAASARLRVGALGRHARHDDLGQGRDQRRGADGRRAVQSESRPSCGPGPGSNCSTATPIPATRSLARRRWQPSTSIAKRAVRTLARRSNRSGATRMSLKGLPNVVDIRCVGLTGGDRSGAVARRRPAHAAMRRSSIRFMKRKS